MSERDPKRITYGAQKERGNRFADYPQAVADLQAAREYDGENLTTRELANRLGVISPSGEIDALGLLVESLYASLNPDVQALPYVERIQLVSSAQKCIDSVVEYIRKL
jgi:hypothetical protein